MDRIVLPAIPLRARVGVTEDERAVEQDIEIEVVLSLDLSPAGNTDDLAETVDYEAVCDTLESVVGSGTFKLIEAIAERAASALLAAYEVDEVRVGVRKPGALKRRGVPWAAVEIHRRRGVRDG